MNELTEVKTMEYKEGFYGVVKGGKGLIKIEAMTWLEARNYAFFKLGCIAFFAAKFTDVSLFTDGIVERVSLLTEVEITK